MVDATCDLTAPGSRLWPCPPSENSMTQVGGAGPFWQKVSGLRSRHPCCVCGRGGGCARSRGHRLPCLAELLFFLKLLFGVCFMLPKIKLPSQP